MFITRLIMTARIFTLIPGLWAGLAGMPATAAEISNLGSGPTFTQPASPMTRPANTTPYSALDIIASNTTAGSIVVPSFAIGTVGGQASIPRIRLISNVTTGWDAVALEVTLFNTAPTFSSGDNTAYAIATGTASIAAKYQVTLLQNADGAWGDGVSTGAAPAVKPTAQGLVYWSLKIVTGSPTPISGQTFTVIPDIWN